MDFEETLHDNGTESAEDVLPEGLVEETEEEPEESLESIGEGLEETPRDEGSEGPKEPKYVQGRIAKAVDKAVAETEARFAAQIEAMEARYAPLMERILEMDAKELVRSGQVKDIETAKELVRYRQGLPAQPSQQTSSHGDGQPRQANGQFAPKEDPAIQARVNMLRHQADQIRADGGPDVIAEYNSNKKVHDAIVSGEMDFYDVARQMKAPKKKPPSPTRSPNGVNGQFKGTIMSMSDKQFEMLEKRVRDGTSFRE